MKTAFEVYLQSSIRYKLHIAYAMVIIVTSILFFFKRAPSVANRFTIPLLKQPNREKSHEAGCQTFCLRVLALFT
jgi:hypothetical protein